MQRLGLVGGVVIASVLACAGGSGSTGEGPTGDPGSSGAAASTGETGVVETGGTGSSGDEPGSSGTPTTGGPGGTTVATTEDGDSSSTAGASSSSSGGAVTGSRCEGSTVTLCEDFEDAQDGGFPANWGARGDEWGEGIIGVASDEAVLGTRALKVDGGDNGQHFMDYKGALGALATHHHGRVFMKVAVPAPWPAGGVLHADFIEGLGPGPKGGTHNVRWGVVENTSMAMQWIFNVQPSNGDPEFGEGTGYDYAWTGEWQCVEWFYDQPTQQGGLWIDGAPLPIVPGQNHAAEIPVFSSLGVGLANYQSAGTGFTVWFDELAYDAERIGCEL